MRKNNWIVYTIAIVISAFLLWLWYHLEFNNVDAPLDFVLSVAWWALVAFACWRIHRIEKRRRERIRTCYLRDGLLYNSEAGTRRIAADAGSAVATMQGVLSGLEYGFDIQDRPEDERGTKLPFDFVVRSERFEIADAGDDTDSRVDWQGEVAVAAHPHDDPIPFGSVDELRGILAALC